MEAQLPLTEAPLACVRLGMKDLTPHAQVCFDIYCDTAFDDYPAYEICMTFLI